MRPSPLTASQAVIGFHDDSWLHLALSAGTNNARLAAMLRQLAQYHAKAPNHLFMVRLAQVGCKKRCRSGTLTYVLEGESLCLLTLALCHVHRV